MEEAIGEWKLICIKPDGEELLVTIRIGKPYQKDEVTWGCPIEAAGLHKRPYAGFGANSFQSLVLALRMLRLHLEMFIRDGGKILFAEDRRGVDLDMLFASRALPINKADA